MNGEDAYRIGRLLIDIDFEMRATRGKGATNSALVAYTKGAEIPLMKVDEYLEFLINCKLIHKVLIGKRYYYRLGEQ